VNNNGQHVRGATSVRLPKSAWSGPSASPRCIFTIPSEPRHPLTLLTSCPRVYGCVLRLGPCIVLKRPLQIRNGSCHLHPRAFFHACYSHDRVPFASRSFTTSQPSTSSDMMNVASNQFTGVIQIGSCRHRTKASCVNSPFSALLRRGASCPSLRMSVRPSDITHPGITYTLK
jgi:hypothetical protein